MKTVPPISTRKENQKGLKDYIHKIVTPIFLKEIYADTRSDVLKKIYRYRPNNYSLKMPILTLITHPKFPMQHKIKKMRGWNGYIIKNYHGCTVEVNKKQIIFYFTEKIDRLIPYPHTKEAVEKVTDYILSRIMNSAKNFKRETNLNFDMKKPTLHRKEIEIKGDQFIDSLPKEMNIHTEVFKKVYDKGVEFFNEPNVVNYINNRALEELSPSLVKELVDIKKLMASSMNTMNAIANTQLMIVQLLKKLSEKEVK